MKLKMNKNKINLALRSVYTNFAFFAREIRRHLGIKK